MADDKRVDEIRARLNTYKDHVAMFKLPMETQFADIEYLLSELGPSQSDARRWKDSSDANRDEAMRQQDRALEAERKLAKAEAENVRLRDALTKMISPDMDWRDGEIGVGHRFRKLARAALEGK